MKSNTHVGGNWESFVEQQKNDPEFVLALQQEFDRLQLARSLKTLRQEKHLSQEQLAQMVGTRQPAIARLEAGRVLPRLDVLERIAHALGARLEVQLVPN